MAGKDNVPETDSPEDGTDKPADISPRLEDILAPFKVSRKHGGDLSVTMGRTIFKSTEMAVLELVANAYDADAKKVEINYDPAQSLLILKDDGSGMNKDGIESFFRMGDSPKKHNRTTPNGRKVIGQFGIASLAVRFLSHNHSLDSYRDGIHYRAQESFGESDQDDRAITISPETDPKNRHGVTITLSGLRFTGNDDRFNVSRLTGMLRREMPLDLEHFEVYTDGELVIPEELNGKYTEYLIDIEDPLLGTVKGRLFYSKRKLDSPGVYTKVNGRAVGGKNPELFGVDLKYEVHNRITGTVDASGMEDQIRFDRTGFQEGPKTARLNGILQDVLRQIQLDMVGDVLSTKKKTAASFIDKSRKEVGKILGAQFREDPYEIIFDPQKSGEVAVLDRPEKKCYVNPYSRALRLGGYNEIDIRQALYSAVEFAVAESLIPVETNRKLFEDLVVQRVKMMHNPRGKRKPRTLADIVSHEEIERADEKFDPHLRISPNRLYEPIEVTRRTGLSNPVIKRLMASEVVGDFEGRILGSEVISLKERLAKRLSIYDAVRKMSVPEGIVDYAFFQNREETGINRLKALEQDQKLPPYIRNLAPQDEKSDERSREPFYVIDAQKVDSFVSFMASGEFNDDLGSMVRRFATGKIGSRSSVKQYCVYLLGFDQKGSPLMPNAIKTMAEENTHFIQEFLEGSSVRLVIKSESYASIKDKKTYVVGIVVGDSGSKVADLTGGLASKFAESGYEQKPISLEALSPVTSELLSKRRDRFPLIMGAEFKPEYSRLLEDILTK